MRSVATIYYDNMKSLQVNEVILILFKIESCTFKLESIMITI